MTLVLLLVSFVCALLGAFVYAAITVRTGWFLNFVLAWGLGLWLALAVTMACTLAKVRNPGVMGQFGLVVGLLGWFAQWVFWIVFACYEEVRSMPGQSFQLAVTDLLASPEALAEGVRLAARATEWDEVELSGVWRALAWLGELAVFLRAPARAGIAQAGKPFCEIWKDWALVARIEHKFSADQLLGARAHLVAHPEQLLAILSLSKAESPPRYVTVTVYTCKAETFMSIHVIDTRFEGKRAIRHEHVSVEYLRVPAKAFEGLMERIVRPRARRAKAGKARSRQAS